MSASKNPSAQGQLFAPARPQPTPPAGAYCVAIRQGYLGRFIAVSEQRWSNPQAALAWRKAEQPRWMGRLEVVPASVLEQ